MSSMATAVVAAAVIGGVAASRSAKKAANAQTASAQMGINAQNAQFERVQELLAPYINAAYDPGTPAQDAIPFDAQRYLAANPDVAASEYWSQRPYEHYRQYGKREGRDPFATPAVAATPGTGGSLGAQQALLGLSGPDAERAAIQRIEQSQGFQSAIQQGENAMLQNASATGGLRGGNLQAALAQFRPRLLASAIEDQYSKLAGITSLGQNAAAGVGNAGMQTGTNTANLLGQMGAAQAGGYLAQGQNTANFVSAVPQAIGAYQGYNRQFGGSSAPQLTTAQQYGTVPGSQQTNMLAAQEVGF